MSFSLTVERFQAIVEYIAGQKRAEMHHLMRKTGKVLQRDIDLGILEKTQAFVGCDAPPKGATMDRYERFIFDTAEKIGEIFHNNLDTNVKEKKIAALADLKNSAIALKDIAAFVDADGSLPEVSQSLVAAYLTIYEEVHRRPTDQDDMLHEELKAYTEKQKTDKAEKGKQILNDSTAGKKPPRKKLTSGGGNDGNRYLRHNEEDSDSDSSSSTTGNNNPSIVPGSGSVVSPLTSQAALLSSASLAASSAAASVAASSATQKRKRAPVERGAHGGTNLSTSEGGSVTKKLDSFERCQQSASELLEMVKVQIGQPGTGSGEGSSSFGGIGSFGGFRVGESSSSGSSMQASSSAMVQTARDDELRVLELRKQVAQEERLKTEAEVELLRLKIQMRAQDK